MPDLAAIMLRRSARSLDSGRPRCAGCRRTPLVGERLHEMDTGRTLCELCVSALPKEDRRAVRSELVHALDKQLSVAPRAA
jgi:CRISPR/Cas system-associated protein Cas10 (large subunit of type III CRISPR-Cas system)